ncbi:MAG: galactokinase family protein [bacterium]|nr:galactokinase family protein [bacterium]
MIGTKHITEKLQEGGYRDLLLDLYVDESKIEYQTNRYIKALANYEEYFGQDDVEIYSAPGRSEIGGNHTDHQHGEVLAASINEDAIAVVKAISDPVVRVISDGYPMIEISLDDITLNEKEKETTTALVKGVLAGTKKHGYKIGGFQAYITSDVLIGAGLSSSAAFETIIGTILSGLYNKMQISAIEIAIIGQYAENVYFGKPCGLMDQMACSVGGLVHVDFSNPSAPQVEKIGFDMNKYGYSLCITDTKGSHADLTADYAAVPAEMKKVAQYFGKEVLLEIDKNMLLSQIAKVREATGDRGVLRAIHFLRENERVKKEVEALKNEEVDEFFKLVKASGDSSFKFLQNIYSNSDVQHQNVSVALAISEMLLEEQGVCRVHGGGFAGTIQAFVKDQAVSAYKNQMDSVFGEGACNILRIRKYGGRKII